MKKVEESVSLRDLLEHAKSDAEGLGEEMGEWRDNLESGNLENTPKYEEVSDVAETFENLDWDFVEQTIEDFEKGKQGDLLDIEQVVVFHIPYRRYETRSIRLTRVLAYLEKAKEVMECFADDESEKGDIGDWDFSEEVGEDLSALEEVVGELEGVGFPGMY
jgi:hypothetical protein